MRIGVVVGARPNFMKAAPLIRRLRKRPEVDMMLIHTGQHYDEAMSGRFFEELDIPRPDVQLEIGSGPNAEQIGRTIVRLAPIFHNAALDVLVVVGDVNATAAAAIAAQDARVPVAHIEAGLRSFDRSMPEEINRVLVDAVADLHFTSCRDANENLQREGVRSHRIHFVGNIMIDTLLFYLDEARRLNFGATLDLEGHRFGLLTLHRPSNVDDPRVLGSFVALLGQLQRILPIVFPVHPRTHRRLEDLGLLSTTTALPGVHLVPALSYREFLSLEATATLVLTDSGGVQEETTFLGVPCLTLRENTERPVTVREGTNELVGTRPGAITEAVERIVAGQWKVGRIPELWDGGTAERIVDVLVGSEGELRDV